MGRRNSRNALSNVTPGFFAAARCDRQLRLMACVAEQRRHEIASRIAIGASARQTVWSMRQRGQILAGAGVLIGVVVALVGDSLLARSVYAMRAADR